MAKVGDFYVGSQLFCGVAEHAGAPLPPVGLGVGPTKIRGSGFIAGPLLVGSPFTFTKGPNVNEANLMVARCGNPEALPPPLSIFKVSSFGFPPTPIDVVIGDLTGPVGIAAHALVVNMIVDTTMNIVSPLTNHIGVLKKIGLDSVIGAEIKKSVRAIFAKEVKIGAFCSAGAKTQNGVLVNNGLVANPISNTPVVVGRATGNKPFDIPHALKKGKRIRHICAEGPEPGIYIRGRLTGSNVIELPEYWEGLVDPETITVSLTQIGSSQDLMVDKIEWGKKVYIKSGNASAIDCFYDVWVARYIDSNDKDKKLHVVYDGESVEDYPGDNSDFNFIGGYQ